MTAKKRTHNNLHEWVRILTTEQAKILKKEYATKSVEELAKKFKVKPESLRSIITRYKIKKPINTEESFYRQKYSSYKSVAKKRKYCFRLSYRGFKKLLIGNCHYCNSSPIPNKLSKSQERKTAVNKIVMVNGIDRVNNKVGYTNKNCVSCCKICNYMKNTSSKKEFLFHIKKILDNCKK